MKKILYVLLLCFACVGCTDSFRANIGGYGKRHHVRMFNGGVLVAEWYSTGKVTSIENSDGWEFMDEKTNKLVRVGGDVIIEVVE